MQSMESIRIVPLLRQDGKQTMIWIVGFVAAQA